jgi:two-component system, LuxR family, response regulator FixJ
MVVESTVHIVDDDPQVRESLDLLVGSVGLQSRTYASAEEFLEGYEDDSGLPKCLVLDVRMPGMSGLKLQETLVAEGAELPVIMITAFGDVPMAVRAMQAGALDFIEKPVNRQVLLERILDAINQDGCRRDEQAKREETDELIATLTDREREVMELLVAGETPKQTSLRFGIGIKTVLKHRARVLEKLRVDTPVELVHLAYRIGLVSPELAAKPRQAGLL